MSNCRTLVLLEQSVLLERFCASAINGCLYCAGTNLQQYATTVVIKIMLNLCIGIQFWQLKLLTTYKKAKAYSGTLITTYVCITLQWDTTEMYFWKEIQLKCIQQSYSFELFDLKIELLVEGSVYHTIQNFRGRKLWRNGSLQ